MYNFQAYIHSLPILIDFTIINMHIFVKFSLNFPDYDLSFDNMTIFREKEILGKSVENLKLRFQNLSSIKLVSKFSHQN